MGVLKVNSEEFEKEVLQAKSKVLVDFNADWCGPCRMLGPVIEELAEEKKDLKVVSVNVDDNSDLAQKYGVMSIPCLLLFKDGKESKRSIGLISKEDLEELVGE